MKGFALTVALLVSVAVAHGDRWGMPRPRFFASDSGAYGFALAPGPAGPLQQQWQGMLFRINPSGEMAVVWKRELVNVPHQLFVSDEGHVVTVDSHGQAGGRHSLVLYSPDGSIVAEYAMEDVISKEEISRTSSSISSRWWAPPTGYYFTRGAFVVPFQYGPSVILRLSDGSIDRGAGPCCLKAESDPRF
jgi:hypothetical protein